MPNVSRATVGGRTVRAMNATLSPLRSSSKFSMTNWSMPTTVQGARPPIRGQAITKSGNRPIPASALSRAHVASVLSRGQYQLPGTCPSGIQLGRKTAPRRVVRMASAAAVLLCMLLAGEAASDPRTAHFRTGPRHCSSARKKVGHVPRASSRARFRDVARSDRLSTATQSN